MSGLLERMGGFVDLANDGGLAEKTPLKQTRLDPVAMPEIKKSKQPSFNDMLVKMQSMATQNTPQAESDPTATLFMTGE